MVLQFNQNTFFKYLINPINDEKYILGSRKNSSNSECTCTIYNNGKQTCFTFDKNNISEDEKLYNILSRLSSEDDIKNFCKNYGTLVNPYSPIRSGYFFRTNKVLKTESTQLLDEFAKIFSHTSLCEHDYDFMVLEHFNYYQKTIQALSIFENYAHENTVDTTATDNLFNFIKSYIPTVNAMLQLEYEYYVDGFELFLNSFPFYRFAYMYYSANNSSIIEKEGENLFPENYLLLLDILSPTVENPIHSKKLCNLLENIIDDIINFHMKDISLFQINTLKPNSASYTFQSLGDAILFQKIFDMVASNFRRRCANELCNKLFIPKRSNQIYCCSTCQKRTVNRKSMRNLREATKDNLKQINK